jgi:hypothetical protein
MIGVNTNWMTNEKKYPEKAIIAWYAKDAWLNNGEGIFNFKRGIPLEEWIEQNTRAAQRRDSGGY